MTRAQILAQIRLEERAIPALRGRARKTAEAYRNHLIWLLRFTVESKASHPEVAA